MFRRLEIDISLDILGMTTIGYPLSVVGNPFNQRLYEYYFFLILSANIFMRCAYSTILLRHEIINNPTNVKAAMGGRAAIGFPLKNIA